MPTFSRMCRHHVGLADFRHHIGLRMYYLYYKNNVILNVNMISVMIFYSLESKGNVRVKKYILKCLEPFIDTHIGSQGITYECAMKDKSLIGVVRGLNRVE